MVEGSHKIDVVISCSELFEMVSALIDKAGKFIEMTAPTPLIERTIDRAEKFNKILKQTGYDHWSKEKFVELRARVRHENIQ